MSATAIQSSQCRRASLPEPQGKGEVFNQLGLWGDEPAVAGLAPAAAAGLSLVHKWPQAGVEVSWCEGAAAGRIKYLGWTASGRVGGLRGQIKGFTGRSRLCMLERVNSIRRSGISDVWFITLTVPSQDECTWQRIEDYRRSWFKRLRRAWGTDWFAVWKKEPHKSGLPHLHVLLFWVGRSAPKVKAFREWNDSAWADVVQSVNPWHRQLGCRVERMRGWNGVAWYCSKYCAKPLETTESTGRIWGIENRSKMPVDRRSVHVPAVVGRRVHRTLRKLQRRKRERWLYFNDGRWEQLAHGWVKRYRGSAQRIFIDARSQADRLRAAGHKVKRWRPKCARTRVLRHWFIERDSSDFVEEVQTFLGGLQLTDSATIARCVQFFESEWRDDPPF